MPNPSYECLVCQREFSNKNHLRRHETSHNPQDHIACEFCGRRYSRTDALRRHYKSCPQIGIQPQPVPGRRGRRRKACDNCAKNREPCDGTPSCAACQEHRLTCTYRRLESPASGPIAAKLDAPALSTSQGKWQPGAHDQRVPDRTSVPFLLNYSAPTNRNPGDVNEVLTLLSTAESRDRDLDPTLPSFDVEATQIGLFAEESWDMFFGFYRQDGDSQRSSMPGGLEDPSQRHLAAAKLIDCLNKVHANHPQASDSYSPERASDFFHEASVRDFTEAYFEHTVRPRSRVVLKSTFNLDLISAPLLLSILIMGATCGTSDGAKSQAVEYATMAEFAVFESPSFLQLMYRQRDLEQDPLTRTDLEFIQAALLVILFQIASPSAEDKRRIRIQRYPALVCVARATSLTRIKNWWHGSSAPLSRRDFLLNESYLRIMASISMVDCHFIMFFNQPPNLIPHELEYDLPAEENGIDISDEMAWETWARNERKYRRPPMVSQFLQELMSDHWTGPDDPRFENLNIFALFIVISAFHRVVFGVRSSLCDMSAAICQVDRALQRWMTLWERLQARLSQDEIYRAGFMIHAQDLWVFARLLLRTPLGETGEIAKDSMSHVHSLLKNPSK